MKATAIWIIAAVWMAASPSAIAQDQPPAHPQQPAHKKPKVWTNDDLGSLHSPADDYLKQKQEEAAQSDTPQQPAAADSSKDVDPVPKAKTVEEAESLIARDKQQIKDQQDYIEATKKQLADAPDSYKERLQWRIESRGQIVDRLQKEVATLEAQRDQLAKKSSQANDSSNQQQ